MALDRTLLVITQNKCYTSFGKELWRAAETAPSEVFFFCFLKEVISHSNI